MRAKLIERHAYRYACTRADNAHRTLRVPMRISCADLLALGVWNFANHSRWNRFVLLNTCNVINGRGEWKANAFHLPLGWLRLINFYSELAVERYSRVRIHTYSYVDQGSIFNECYVSDRYTSNISVCRCVLRCCQSSRWSNYCCGQRMRWTRCRRIFVRDGSNVSGSLVGSFLE